MNTVGGYPGAQSLSIEAAELLAARGTLPAEWVPPPPAHGVHVAETDAQSHHRHPRIGCAFSHDVRLLEASPIYLTEGQTTSIMEGLACPVLCVTASAGWPWPDGVMLGRLSSIPQLEHHHVEGGHHLHLDPDTAPAVARIVEGYLERGAPGVARRQLQQQQITAALPTSGSGGRTVTTRSTAAADITASSSSSDEGGDAAASLRGVRRAGTAASLSAATADDFAAVPLPPNPETLMGQSHVFIARSVPWTVGREAAAEAAVAVPTALPAHPPPRPARRVHMHRGALEIVALGGAATPADTALRFHTYPDSLLGSTARLLRARGIVGSAPLRPPPLAGSGGDAAGASSGNSSRESSNEITAAAPALVLGAWAPRVFLERVTTLERAMASRGATASKDIPKP